MCDDNAGEGGVVSCDSRSVEDQHVREDKEVEVVWGRAPEIWSEPRLQKPPTRRLPLLAMDDTDDGGVPNACIEEEHACQRFHLVVSHLEAQAIVRELPIHVC